MRLALIATCLTTPALADPLIATLSADLTGDGAPEQVFVIRGSDANAHLLINQGDGGHVFTGGIAFAGGIGQEPELELAKNGSLKLISMNESIGRHRWRETLTIAWRHDVFVVAGYTYLWYDTLSLEQGLCDVNLLTGQAERTENDGLTETTQLAPRALPVREWGEHAIPEFCAMG